MNPIVMAICAAALVVFGGLVAHATVDRAQLEGAQLETANLRTQVETNRADANQATIDGIQKAIADTLAAEAALRADAQARLNRYNRFLQELANAPDSKVCTHSPAFRVFIDSVRREDAGSHN